MSEKSNETNKRISYKCIWSVLRSNFTIGKLSREERILPSGPENPADRQVYHQFSQKHDVEAVPLRGSYQPISEESSGESLPIVLWPRLNTLRAAWPPVGHS